MINVGLLLMAYIIGLFPSAYIYSKLFKKLDVRTMGTGNIGGMNTLVHIGILPGILTIITDALKGYTVVFIALRFGTLEPIGVLSLCSLIFAHNYNPLMDFKGGKGFANLGGGLLILAPLVIPLSFLVTLMLLPYIRVPRVAPGVAVWTFPFFFYWQGGSHYYFVSGLIITLLIFSKHIKNLKWYFLEYRHHHSSS